MIYVSLEEWILILDKHGIIESLLYTAGDEGLDEKQLLEILEINQAKLSELISSYTSSGLIIQKFGSTYILTSKRSFTLYWTINWTKSNMKLSQAAMETLSIIAYNQPLSRSDIELIRGINSDGAVRTLIARGLIEAKDVENSRSHALQTTDLF